MTGSVCEIFKRVIDPERGDLQEPLTRYLAELNFSSEDHKRFEQLSSQARDGVLSDAEIVELEGFLNVDVLLCILRLKAERSLHS